jgi:hypothetical protein
VFFYSCGKTPVAQCLTNRPQLIIASVFYGIFPIVVDEPGALLSLIRIVAAELHEAANHPVEGVHIVVVDYNGKAILNIR